MSQHVSEFPSLVRPGSIPFLIDTAFHLSVLPSMASGVAPALAVVHSAAVNTRVWTCKKLCAYARLSEKDSTYSPRESPFTAQTSWCVFGPMRVSDDHSARAVTEAEPLKKKCSNAVQLLGNVLVSSRKVASACSGLAKAGLILGVPCAVGTITSLLSGGNRL